MFQGSAIVLAVLFAASPGCSGTWDSSHPDTLAQVVDDGIVLRLEGLRDTYTLDDTVSGAIVLVNQSSEEPFFLQTGSLERITWSIARRDNPQPEFYEPTVGLPVEWRDTLDRGDTIATGVRWRQETCYPAMPSLYYMKAFSGEYRLRGEMWGNPHLQDRILTKSFRITEEGDSLASCLVWHFSKDSLNFDFVVRNRTSRLLEHSIVDALPLKLSLTPRMHAPVLLSYPVPFSTLRLSPFSDETVFQLRLSIHDRVFESVRGQMVRLKCVLQLRERKIEGERQAYIFK